MELGFRIKYSGKLSRPGFRFSQAKIFQNFGVRTLSKVTCAGENLTREKNSVPLVTLIYQQPITRNDNFHAFMSQCFDGPLYFKNCFGANPGPTSQGNMSGNTRGYIGFSAPGEGKIHHIVLVRREEGGGIANFVKSRMVSMGISRGFIAKKVL